MLKRNREAPFQRMDTLGMRSRLWVRLLQEVERPVHRGFEHRALGSSALALVNSLGHRVRRVTDAGPLPLADDVEVTFILGHWRSGTTFLHHLLAADPRFATLPTSMAVFPDLHGTPLLQPVLDALGIGRPYQRLIDNVVIGPDAPMELEFAILNLTGLSEYLSVAFPRSRRDFLRFLRADPAACTPGETAAWRRAVVETTGRLARGGRHVLHKNPPSTATLLELKAIFPRARFVFLHREPVGCYLSTLKTWQTLTVAGTLQNGGDAGLEDYVLDRYELLHRAYLDQRDRLAPGELVELSFEDLLADPMGAVARVHEGLGWGPMDRPVFQAFLDGVKSYERGSFSPPDPAIAERVTARWGPIHAELARRTAPARGSAGVSGTRRPGRSRGTRPKPP